MAILEKVFVAYSMVGAPPTSGLLLLLLGTTMKNDWTSPWGHAAVSRSWRRRRRESARGGTPATQRTAIAELPAPRTTVV